MALSSVKNVPEHVAFDYVPNSEAYLLNGFNLGLKGTHASLGTTALIRHNQ